MRCQGQASAWRILIRGLSVRDEENDLKSNCGSILATCVRLDTAFPVCYSLCSLEISVCILLACYFKRSFHPSLLLACMCVSVLCIVKSSLDSSFPGEHRSSLLFYISTQSFTPGFPFDYLMNQHPKNPALWFLENSKHTFFSWHCKRIWDQSAFVKHWW